MDAKFETSNFYSYPVDNSCYKVISINLKRAVIDYVGEFKEYLKKHHSESKTDLILDFSNTNFIDSSFLGTIISLLKKVKISSGTLSLVVDSSKMTFFLPIKNISKVINIYPSVGDAVANNNRYSVAR